MTLIRKLPFFSELGQDELAEVASRVQERTFGRGEVILLEGEAPRAVYFIVRGQVRIYRLSPEGREQVLKRLGPGEAFNLVPVLDGGPNPSSAMAWTDVTVYAVERGHFVQMVREHPALAVAVLTDFAAKLRHMTALVEDLSLRTVGARLAKLLLTQAAEGDAAPRRMTQQEMAAQLGTVREVVGRALAELEREGLIRMERHRIVIVDRSGLEAKAML
ncbi:MAG: Crp/Fnr family transcriptional regulator [Anaerolineae bacterium]